MKKTSVGVTAGVLVAVAFLVFFASRNEAEPPSDVYLNGEQSTGIWLRGNQEAKVSIIEFSDFQCPACSAYEPVLQELMRSYSEQVRLDYRHFPLPQHQNAEPAARAAEAAGVQGKFWEMHDILFNRQRDWSEAKNAKEIFTGYARDLELQLEKFQADYDSAATMDRITNDVTAATALKVNSTPTFFLNGRKIASPAAYDAFRDLIEAELKNIP